MASRGACLAAVAVRCSSGDVSPGQLPSPWETLNLHLPDKRAVTSFLGAAELLIVVSKGSRGSMMLLSTLIATLLAPALTRAVPGDSFHESLTLHPLPDGKLSVLFEFTTYFTARTKTGRTREDKSRIHDVDADASRSAQSHHSLTPPALLLPLERHNVSELTISFVAGQWDQRRSGEAGPLSYDTGGGGGEVRGWLRDSGSEKQYADSAQL